ncbi:hypothetical protein ONZ45_g14476 [Pleurotus djamor]|nr:hypothetical protein ONZ45_g14476 [Pleurotus djamor]
MTDTFANEQPQDHEALSHEEGEGGAEAAALQPEPRTYVNGLTPPADTGYWSRQDFTVFSNHQVNDTGSSHYVTIDWKFAAYVYATGARPDQANFASSGGVMYFVLVHQGYINSTLFPDTQDVTLVIRPQLDAAPDRQLPEYTRIEYRQTLAMLKRDISDFQNFDAEYTLDFQLEKMEQSGRTYNDRLEIYYRPLPGSAWQTPREINALSVIRDPNPPVFPVNYLMPTYIDFEIVVTFDNRTTRASQTVAIPLNFQSPP